MSNRFWRKFLTISTTPARSGLFSRNIALMSAGPDYA